MGEYELGVIGAGNMGEAILRGVTRASVISAERIICSDPLPQRREQIRADINVHVTEDNLLPAGCPRLLLAVKPQVMGQVLEQIAPAVGRDALVITIAAGINTAFVDAKLAGKGRIVRVMPNTPMLVGMGVSVVAAGPRAGDADAKWTEKLFAACGQTVRVAEPMMDAVTAVSGSGPAYFFYLVEAIIEAGIAEGLPPDVVDKLARATCRGAGQLLAESAESPEALRRKVTSPGGATQRAIETMQEDHVKELLVKAVRAAARRSRELGG